MLRPRGTNDQWPSLNMLLILAHSLFMPRHCLKHATDMRFGVLCKQASQEHIFTITAVKCMVHTYKIVTTHLASKRPLLYPPLKETGGTYGVKNIRGDT